MNKKLIPPFSTKDEIGYMSGDIAGSFIYVFAESYFLTFCTYALGIDPQWMAGLFLVARLLDALLGPVIGSLPDRWRLGKSSDKFSPWVTLFAIPLALSGICCFTAIPLDGHMRYLWIAICYFMYSLCYSGASIPYGAMANVITDKPEERNRLSLARSIGGTLVNFGALSIVPIFCFDKDANVLPHRFTVIAIIFALGCLFCYFILSRLTNERIHETEEKKKPYKFSQIIKTACCNRPLIGIMLASMGCMMLVANGQLSSYIYKEYYHNAQAMTIGNLLNLPIIFVCFVFVPKFVKRFGKRNVTLSVISLSLLINVYKFIVPVSNVWIYTILFALGNLGQVIFNMLVWAFVSDCLDYSEWKFGIRSDGSMYGIYMLSRKLGSTIAATAAASALSAIGYVAGNNVTQSVSTIHAIYYLSNSIPIIICVIELIGLGLIYNLTQKTNEQMYHDLTEKRT